MYRLKSIYINNFKCLQNFELKLGDASELLLLAKNGMGKSTVLVALRILRKIALGEIEVSRLFSASDFSFGNRAAPMRFKLVLSSSEGDLSYEVAIGCAKDGRLVVEDESLTNPKGIVFSKKDDRLISDDRLLLPMLKAAKSFCSALRDWILIMPIPALMVPGRSATQKLDFDCGNFIAWLKRLMGENPAGYDDVHREFAVALKDYESFQWNDVTEGPVDNLYLTFGSSSAAVHRVAFGSLSDGEKISLIGATLVALSRIRPGFLCFWDEPDNYLAVSEVHGFITRLRKYLRIRGCQLILTSHNLETIRTIGIDSTKLMHRTSHLEPVRLIDGAERFATDANRDTYLHDILSGELYVD